VTEIFASFQGEGVHTGLPTTFVRLAGCSLECNWCDTLYSRDPAAGRPMSIEEIMDQVRDLGLSLVCITGGEPLEQADCITLVERLLEEGHRVDIETNGSRDIRPLVDRARGTFLSVDVKTPSSGMAGSFLTENLGLMDEYGQLKFIVKDGKDLEFALDFIREKQPRTNIIITPCSNKGGSELADSLLSSIRSSAMPFDHLNGRIRFMVQSHKVIWGDDRQGV